MYRLPFSRGTQVVVFTRLLLALSLSGCASLPAGFQAKSLSPAEKMMWSTYVVGTPKGMATCFVVARKDAQAPGGVVPVVVTSVHVLNTACKGPFYFGVRTPDSKGLPQLAIVEYLPQGPDALPFVRHPRQDIAAFALPIPAEAASTICLPSFIDESAVGRPGDRPHVGQNVSLLGFPAVFPATPGAFPVLRGGKVASYSVGLPAEQQRFLINTNVYPGDSGGPVFAVSDHGNPRLIGMVTQRVGRDPRAAVPIAVAVDACAIRETLQLLPTIKRPQSRQQMRPKNMPEKHASVQNQQAGTSMR